MAKLCGERFDGRWVVADTDITEVLSACDYIFCSNASTASTLVRGPGRSPETVPKLSKDNEIQCMGSAHVDCDTLIQP